jgi:glycosyltransferase involved in cell wall biosynthesis
MTGVNGSAVAGKLALPGSGKVKAARKAGGKVLRVAVLKDRYQSSFMSPRVSRHEIVRTRFIPFNYIARKYDGVTLLPPTLNVDLVHAHNRVPLGVSNLIMSFESHLPRYFASPQDTFLLRRMNKAIASDHCRRIVGMSHFARRVFLRAHADNPDLEVLKAKLMVRHPNLIINEREDALDLDASDPALRVTFVGAHFGRKGGCVAVKLAEKARERGVPIHVTVISSLETGGMVWTDPTAPDFFEPYKRLLDAPNVTYHAAQPNAVVREILGRSHFSLLATFADTFGYSAIESMAEFTPVIATRVCALPEFIEDGVNGFLLPLDTDDVGEWRRPPYEMRGAKIFEKTFRDDVERLAEEALARLLPFVGRPQLTAPLRRAARDTAVRMFNAEDAAAAWDDLYARVCSENSRTAAVLDPAEDYSSAYGYAAALQAQFGPSKGKAEYEARP